MWCGDPITRAKHVERVRARIWARDYPKEMLHGKLGTPMHGGEFAFVHRRLAWVSEVHEEVGAPIAKHIKTKCDEVSGTSKWGIVERHQEGDRDSSRRNGNSFHDWLLDYTDRWKLHDDEYALNNMGLASENVHLGDDKFPGWPYCCEHFRQAHGFASFVQCIS